jgi:hypothetical protein
MTDTNPDDAPEIIPRSVFAESDTTDVTMYGFANVATVNEVMAAARNNAPGHVSINILEVLPHKVSYTQTWETQADGVAFTDWLRESAQDNLRNAYIEFLARYRAAYQVTQTTVGENIDYSRIL